MHDWFPNHYLGKALESTIYIYFCSQHAVGLKTENIQVTTWQPSGRKDPHGPLVVLQFLQLRGDFLDNGGSICALHYIFQGY